MSSVDQSLTYPPSNVLNYKSMGPINMECIYPPNLHPVLKTSQAAVVDLSTFTFESIDDRSSEDITVELQKATEAVGDKKTNRVLRWVSLPFSKQVSSGFWRLKPGTECGNVEFGSKQNIRQKLNNFVQYVVKYHLILARSKRDMLLLFYSFCYLFVCTFIVCLANTIADRTNTNAFKPASEKYVAPDLLLNSSYKVFESSTWIPKDIADIFVQTCFLMIIGRVLLMGRWTVTVIRRGFYIIGTLYLLRAPMVVLTVLPSPWVNCVTNVNSSLLAETMQLLSQQKLACGDVFFSGHSIIFTSLIFVYWIYNRPCSPFFKSTGRSFLIPATNNPFYDVIPSKGSGHIQPSGNLPKRSRCRSSVPALSHFSSYPTLPKLKNSSLQLETLSSEVESPDESVVKEGSSGRQLEISSHQGSASIPLAQPARVAFNHHSDSCVEHPPVLFSSVSVNLAINIFVTLFGILGMYSLIFSSYHYTIDVLSGFIFTATAWVVYHWYVRVRQLREETWLGRFIWSIDDPDYVSETIVTSNQPSQSLYFHSSSSSGFALGQRN